MADAALQTPMLPAAPAIRPIAGGEEWAQRLLILLLGGWLFLIILLPLTALFRKALENEEGAFVGLANFVTYFHDPALVQSLFNTLTVALVTTFITIILAFGFAYAITRSTIPFRNFFRSIALVPLLAPSLLPGLALVYLFGNQGIFKNWLFGETIYGPIGIVIGEVFFALPHAVMIIVTALSAADQRLYEAAESLRTKPFRIFMTVTLPGCRYGLVSAAFVVFTLAFTDFGVPKVIGGQYNVLATDVYRQVIGQFNFQMGAVVGLLLLAPAVLSFAVDRMVQRKQVALLSARAVPYQPTRRRAIDAVCLALCLLVSVFVLSILGMAIFGSLIKFWPYKPHAHPRQIRPQRRGRGRMGIALEQPDHGLFGGGDRPGGGVRRRLSGREDQGLALGAGRRAFPGDDPACGPRAGARPRLHFLLQRARQSARFHLRHDGDPGGQHRRPFLHRVPSDGGDGAETGRYRI